MPETLVAASAALRSAPYATIRYREQDRLPATRIVGCMGQRWVRIARISDPSREAARLVLVEGVTPTEAAAAEMKRRLTAAGLQDCVE